MVLTLEEANRIAQGAMEKAEELNVKVSVAVCDAGGRLIALQRTKPGQYMVSTDELTGRVIACSSAARQAWAKGMSRFATGFDALVDPRSAGRRPAQRRSPKPGAEATQMASRPTSATPPAPIT